MNRKALIKMSLYGVLLAVILSLASLLFLNRITAIQASRFRDDFLTFYASSLERKIQNLSVEQIRNSKKILQDERGFGPPPFGPPRGAPSLLREGQPMPPPPDFAGRPMMPPPPPGGFHPRMHEGPPSRNAGPEMWLITATGDILSAKENAKWDLNWEQLPRPAGNKKLVSKEDFFRLKPSISVIKLNAEVPLYLVVRDTKPMAFGRLLATQAILTSAMIVIALVIALAALFFYLHKKSKEARSVLRRLEEGDLKARFEIKRFDEFGELMLDFNRMAEEIEMLVGRIHSTEKKRKELLQELGHDLRTPLASLKTNFETLELHHEKLSNDDKTNLFGVLNSEVDYLKDLIEKLMTIAALDEPHYKTTTIHVDLQELLTQEIKARQNAAGNGLTWMFNGNLEVPDRIVLGDTHLILRLVRNGLDNAARYAETKVVVDLKQEAGKIQIQISDDGPGFDSESLKTFGVRKEFQGRKIGKNGHISLGLGAVIMRTIAELHNGSIRISNLRTEDKNEGALLNIELPLAP
ncbi:ATP-binding protein [Bdellovibrio bacteriovorus]|uniref:sensor histidine kinase n=1 Tax=Bdellovibrio bacteriovorus TaxID=959 RepID=UPI0035A58226